MPRTSPPPVIRTSPSECDEIVTPEWTDERIRRLQQKIERQRTLLLRWRTSAHTLNNLFLVLRCLGADGEQDSSLNEMVNKAATELRGVLDESRAEMAMDEFGQEQESAIKP